MTLVVENWTLFPITFGYFFRAVFGDDLLATDNWRLTTDNWQLTTVGDVAVVGVAASWYNGGRQTMSDT